MSNMICFIEAVGVLLPRTPHTVTLGVVGASSALGIRSSRELRTQIYAG